MKAIVAVDKNWAIGLHNKLLASIPEDMKFFRTTTTGNLVIMGRKTLESFPHGKPLPNRVNIVISRNPNYDGQGAIVVSSIEEALKEAAKYPDLEHYVIGGSSIYEALIDQCKEAYVTYIDHEYQADAYFPNLEKKDNWEEISRSEEETCFDLCYYFTRWKNKNK